MSQNNRNTQFQGKKQVVKNTFEKGCQQRMEKFGNEMSKLSLQLTLRGGGCGASKQKAANAILVKSQLPSNFCGDLEQYLNIVTDKSHLANDEQQKEEILLALQWLYVMKEHFNTLCQQSTQFYDVIFKTLPNLLQSTIIYLRISGFMCLQVLQVINDLARVLFSFFMTNGNRFLKIEDKQMLMNLISEVEVQIELSNTKVAEFEILMIKAVIQSAPSNSDEGENLLIDFMGGMVKSFLTMSPTDEFLDTLVAGAKFLFSAYKTYSLKQKYEIYYYFETLKWQVIACLKNGYPIKRILLLLGQAYEKYIEGSTDWIINSSWVKMIGFLIQYRPIVSKEELGEDKITQQSIWEKLIQRKIIVQLSVDKNLGRLLLVQQLDGLGKIKSLMKRYQIFQTSLLGSLQNSGLNNFILKLKNQREIQQKDYLELIFSENVNEWLQFTEEKEHIEVFESFVQNQNEQLKGLQKAKAQDEKAAKQLLNNLTDNLNDYISRVFNSLLWSNSIKLKIELHIKKYKMISEAILQETQNQIELKSLLRKSLEGLEEYSQTTLEKYYNELQDLKFLIIEEKIQITYSLQKSILTVDQTSDQGIEGLAKKGSEFFRNLKLFKKSYLTLLVKFDEIKQIYKQTIKKGTIVKFTLQNPSKYLQNVFLGIINCQKISQENIENLYQNKVQTIGSDNSSSSQITIQNLTQLKLLEQLVGDLQNQLSLQKEMLEFLKNFQDTYKTSLQNISIKQQVIKTDDELITGMIEQQFVSLQIIFSKIEEDLSQDYAIEDILIQLKKDENMLKNMLTKEASNAEVIKKYLFQTKIISEMIKQAQTTEEIYLLKSQILQIYQNLIKKKEENHDQENNQIKQGMNQSEENNKFVTDIIEILSKSIQNCQLIYLSLSKLLKIYLKTFRLSLSLGTHIDILRVIEQCALKNLESLFSVFKQNRLDLTEKVRQANENALPIINMQSIDINFQDITLSTKQIDTLLILYDQVLPQKEKINDVSLFQKAKGQVEDVYQSSLDYIHKYNYKVKQCYVVILLTIQSSQLEQNVILYCQDNIVQIWATEKDQRVKAILKDKEMIEMQKRLFSNDLQTFQEKFQRELKEKVNAINDLEQKVNLEGDVQIRQQLQNQLQQQHAEFEEYIDNINDMSSKLDITLQFLKEIRKDLTQIKTKIDKLQDTMNQLGDDVRKLRGKTFYELFEYRKQKVLYQKSASNLTQIYIQTKVQEWDPITGKKKEGENQESKLFDEKFDNQEGEVNEFIQDDLKTKDVMLIKGCAGSGKSRAAQKIEEFFWENRELEKFNWIPIYVSLPTLKEPKFNLFEEALTSDLQFDKIQIRELKDAIIKQELKIILILDSYDEMRQDCIQSNLIQTNRLFDLFGTSQQNCIEYFKVIITTRSEILTSTSYQTWFYGKSLQSLKEIELIGFSGEQQDEYLRQYSYLSVKKEIYDLYEFVKKVTQEQIDLDEFKLTWKQVENSLMKNDQKEILDFVVNEQEAQKIIQLLKKEKCFKNISSDQGVNLQKRLISLWSHEKFKLLIQRIKISYILTTPFMMEIVVQVLPSMIKKYSNASLFKDQFIENFIQIKSDDIKQRNLIQQYNKMKELKNSHDQLQISEDLFQQQAKGLWDKLLEINFFTNDRLMKQIDKSSLQNIEEAIIVIRALRIKAFTVYDFYSSFIEFYHQWQIKKLKDLGKIFNNDGLAIDLFNFSQSLAIELTKKELTQVKFNAKGKLKLNNIKQQSNDEEWKDVYFNDFGENGEYTKLIRNCTLLTQKGSIYSFSHKSIQEYYVAQYILTFLNQLHFFDKDDFSFKSKFKQEQNKPSVQELSEKEITQKLRFQQYMKNVNEEIFNNEEFNVSKNNFKGVLYLMKLKLNQIKGLKNKLIQIVQLSSVSAEFIRASSNSLYLLSFQQEYLAKIDFSNIQIRDTKMIGLSFYKSSFENSKFTNVSISSCNFNCANLSNVDWTKMYCNELPNLVIDEKNRGLNDVSQILFQSDEQHIISHSSQSKTMVWDYKQGSCKLDFESDKINDGKFKLSNTNIALHPTNLYLALAVQNKIFQWQKNKWQTFDQDHVDYINDIAYSQDGNFLAYGGDFRLVIMNFQSFLTFENVKMYPETVPQRQAFKETFFQVGFSPDGLMLAASTQNEVMAWKFQSEAQPRISFEYKDQEKLYDRPSFLFNGNVLAIWTQDKSSLIKFYDITASDYYYPISYFEGHSQYIVSAAFSQDGTLFASGGQEKSIILWEVRAKQRIANFNTTHTIRSLAFSKDCQILAYGGNQGIRFRDVQASREMIALDGHSYGVNKVEFSPDGLYLASCTNKIALWEARTGKMLQILDGHGQNMINSLSFSPDGLILASGSDDHQIILWDITQREILSKEQNEECVSAVIFSPDGKLLASGLKNSQIKIWQVQQQQLKFIQSFECYDQHEIECLAFSPDSCFLALVVFEFVQIWSMEKSIMILTFFQMDEIDQRPISVEFSRDGGILAVASRHGAVVLWNTKDIELNEKDSQQRQDEINNRFLGYLDDQTPRLLIQSICFSQNGQLVASGCSDNLIRIWDFQKKQKIADLQGHEGNVVSVKFSPNDSVLVSCSEDTTIRLWDMQNEKGGQIKPICFKIIAQSQELQAIDCQVKEATVVSKSGFNLKKLFLQKGAIDE